MFKGTKVVTISTKRDEDEAAGTKTVITYDFTGATEEHVISAAMRQWNVDMQNKFRKNGIPATVTVKVAELGTGRRSLTAEELQAAALAQAMADPKYRADMLAKLTALGMK